jgi:glycosyltransferase involved in cell wall biosynthesis
MNQTAKRPLLSLCMIVKNEAEYLETCLRLARPHVDEIVIIDTGSTDGTQEIARRYADVFEEIEWPNSFAAARNYSLERASGEYILILDGDEYIADPRSWALLRQLLIEQRPVAVRLFVRNVLPASEIIAADLLWQERVF